MELKDYLRILRKRGWIIVLVAILTASAAFGFSKLQTVDSRIFAQRVINALGLDMLPETLKGHVTIASIDEDYIIQIDVIDTNGDQANRIADEWANQFVLWRNQDNANQLKQDRVDANSVQNAAYVQFRPQTTLNTVAGGIIGLMVGALIVFFLESIESNILRAPDDIERALGITVLAAIPVTGGESNRARKKSSV
jgi:capsular polysaccharide biosynthesis protein